MARVTSSLFVSAFIRRTYAAGTPAVVSRRGAEEAGAIFVVIDRLDGTADLYGPAPQSEASGEDGVDRLFERLLDRAGADVIRDRIGREARFDPDLWVVEVEDREGRFVLDLAGG